MEFQGLYAKAADKPVIVMEPFGTGDTVPAKLREFADEVVPWNEREMSDAIRRQARHEETTRWDTIEFKLD
jgi:predicted aldo/keto reductase-like oxidoreductase